MTRYSFLSACTALLACLASTAVAAEKKPEPLAVRLSARITPIGSDVIVRARVEPDARSRELTIEWIGDDLSGGSHAISMDGARAPITHQFPLKGMAAGEYQVTAILRLNDGSEIRRSSTVMVVGAGGFAGVGASGIQGSAGGRVRPATQP